MDHVNDDQLLLLAYGELDDTEARQAEAHLATCQSCRARLERLERARVASEWDGHRARRLTRRWIVAAGLAAAAVLASFFLPIHKPVPVEPDRALPTVWSRTAGYIAGGSAVVQIDAQLTRLEQERYNAFPD